jgi:serine/threonine-protein kinase RsbW
MAKLPTENKIVVKSRFEEVGRAEHAIIIAAEAHGFDETACFAIKLSLEEALTNAIKHGNEFDPDKSVTVEYHVSDKEVRVRICDQGTGFRPARVPDPTLDENLEKPHGRGIMLMRAYMNEVQFSPDGRCVTMIKKRQCSQAS